MDLTGLLLRAAAGRPLVLLIGVPGADRLRARVEHEVAHRRWPWATAPADADVLLVVGRPDSELAALVDDVWSAVPAPRARLQVEQHHEIIEALDGAVALLRDGAVQRVEAPRNGLRPARRADRHEGDGEHDDGHDGRRGGPDDGPDSGVGDHGRDGGHHHDGGGTELPGGLAMADVGEDRDGLALDRLHVALGPVLPEWPPGLVVEVALQGDVIQSARCRFLDADDRRTFDPLPPAARGLEAVARVLALAGWAGPAARARRLRDAVLTGEAETARTLEDLDALRRRLRRSRVLRWMLHSPVADRRDVYRVIDDRLLAARGALTGGGQDTESVEVDLAALDDRLTGAEFAAARLIVAAADPIVRPAPARSRTAEDPR